MLILVSLVIVLYLHNDFLEEPQVGFEPTCAEQTAYKTVPIDHYGTEAFG